MQQDLRSVEAHQSMNLTIVRIGIITVSDRASRGEYEDRGGPAIRDYLTEVLSCPWEPVACVIADELELITDTIKKLADNDGCSLIITTGGT